MQQVNERRAFIKKYFIFGSVFLGMAAVLIGCDAEEGSPKPEKDGGKTNPCEDLSGVSKKDIETRVQAAYVTKSPLPDKECGNCNLFIPPAAGKDCGACMLFKGPVSTSGYCIYWAPPATQ